MAVKQRLNALETPRPSGVLDTIATVAVIGIGAALIRTRWIPGILIGIGAMAAPKVWPELTVAMKPLVRSAVRGGLRAAEKMREAAADASEELEGIVTQVRAEQEVASDAERPRPLTWSATTH